MKISTVLLFVFTFMAIGCSATQESLNPPKPVAMVVTANPLATKAGLEILQAGGSAMDAAVAVESVLGLVEPQSSGFGGGGFLVHYDAKSKKVDYYNGREKAPMGVTKKLFLDENGKPLPFIVAKDSGLSVGVPGIVSMLNIAHKDHGKLAWKNLFARALNYSEEGFAVSPRMHHSIVKFQNILTRYSQKYPKTINDYFHLENGDVLPIGHILTNPEYAKTLRILAVDPMDFYRGKIAKKIVAAVQEMPMGGALNANDLASFTAVKRAPYCSKYRNTTLCGSALPSSWVSVSMVMSILNDAPPFSAGGADDPNNWTLLAEALRITYADNNQFIADDNFIDVPIEGLMSEAYIKTRAKLISRKSANNNIKAGNPWAYQDRKTSFNYGDDATYDTHGTSHFVIVDAEGNAVSMTATVESYFGSLRMAGGMILNNELTDFSFTYEDANGQPIANAVAPGKYPRSSMSPTIVLDENNNFLMAVGSPGGRNIISYVAKAVVGIMSWGLTPQEAINLPNMVAKTKQVRIEYKIAKPEITQALKDFGYNVYQSEGEISGLSAVLKLKDGTLQGGVDRRREGTVGILFDDMTSAIQE